VYEVFAIRYGTRPDSVRADFFLDGDSHDVPMVMDYYVWLVRGAHRTFVVDTGFSAETARRRRRMLLHRPSDALARLDVDCTRVTDVIITHLHYDHVGAFGDFPAARFHLQDREMGYATGRYMRSPRFNRSYEVEDVVGMVRLVYGDRVVFHDGDAELSPGLTLHRIGGHTDGLQCVRVQTRRGMVVLASDASQFYEHMASGRCGHTIFNLGDIVDGYDRLRRLADSDDHVIPGHDPLVMELYPAASADLAGIAVRLDVPPQRGAAKPP